MRRIIHEEVGVGRIIDALGVGPLRPPLGPRDAIDQKLPAAAASEVVGLLKVECHPAGRGMAAEERAAGREAVVAEGGAVDAGVPQEDRPFAVRSDIVVIGNIDEDALGAKAEKLLTKELVSVHRHDMVGHRENLFALGIDRGPAELYLIAGSRGDGAGGDDDFAVGEIDKAIWICQQRRLGRIQGLGSSFEGVASDGDTGRDEGSPIRQDRRAGARNQVIAQLGNAQDMAAALHHGLMRQDGLGQKIDLQGVRRDIQRLVLQMRGAFFALRFRDFGVGTVDEILRAVQADPAGVLREKRLTVRGELDMGRPDGRAVGTGGEGSSGERGVPGG